MSGSVVTFVYSDWTALYPEFSTTVTTAPQAQGYFDQATVLQENTGYPISDPTTLTTLLYLLTAHVALLFAGSNGNPVSPLVGRISSATEGSVSVGTEMPGATANSAWFQQTRYGALYWQMTAAYRTMRYIPNPRMFCGYPARPGRFW